MASNGSIWIEEYFSNPSLAAVCFETTEGEETRVFLTRAGVEVTADLLLAWLDHHDEQMNKLYADLESLGEDDG